MNIRSGLEINKISKAILSCLFLIMLVFLCKNPVQAAIVEKSIGFQGQLLNEGTPVNDSVAAVFKFYDAASGGSLVGSIINKTVTVSNGYFSTTFTDSDLNGITFDQALWLEVTVNGSTLSPRTVINTVPYAYKSFGVFSHASAPTVGPAGSIYFNTSTNKLFASDGVSWSEIGVGTSSLALSPNALLIGSSSGMATELAAGTENQILAIDGTGKPSWTSTPTFNTLLVNNSATFYSANSSHAVTINGSGGTGNGLLVNGALHIGDSSAINAFDLVSTSGVSISNSTTYSRASVGAGVLVVQNKIGIGTTTPGSALTVAGDIQLTGALSIAGNTGSSGQVLQSTATGLQWVSTSTLGFPAPTGSGTVNSGTTGQMAFYAANGTTISATSSLIVNGNNIGIGISPLSKLHVEGGSIYANAPQSDTVINGGAGNDWQVYGNLVGSAGLWAIRTGTDASINFDTNNSFSPITALTIKTDGSIGVGTSTPIAKLAIKGSGTGSGKAFAIANSSGVEKMYITDNGTLHLASTLFVQGGGSIQWGDSSIAGSITGFLSNASDGVFRFGDSSGGGSPRIILGSASAGWPALSRNGAGLDIKTGDNSTYTYLTASHFLAASTTATSGFAGQLSIATTTISPSTLYVQGQSGTNPFSIASTSGSSLFTVLQNGNVGIGNASPLGKFVITHTSASPASATSTASTAGMQFEGAYGSGTTFLPGIAWTTSDNNSTVPKGTITVAPTAAGSLMHFGTSNNYAGGTNIGMTLDYNGRLGIGTTTPTASALSFSAGGINPWAVNSGGVYLANSAGSPIAGFNNSVSADLAVFSVFRPGGSVDAGDFQFYALGPSYVTSGIYTPSTVVAAARSNFTGGLKVGSQGGGLTFFTGGIATSNIAGGIDISQRWGIGTTSPLRKLEVFGTGTTISGSYASNVGVFQDHTNYRGVELGYDSSGQIGVVAASSNGNASALAFWKYNGSAWGEGMRLDANGNVGIGTTTPVAKLSVKGNATSTGLLAQFTDSANVARFTVLDNGFVGIGTTTPGSNLSILSSGNGVSISANSGGAGFALNREASTGGIFNTSLSAYQFTQQGSGFETQEYSGVGAFVGRTILNGGNFGIVGTDATTSATNRFWVNGNMSIGGSAYKAVTAPTNGLLIQGNVGIATTTPSYTLSLAGDFNLTGALRTNGNSGTSGMVLQTTGTGLQWVATSSLGISSGSGSGTVSSGTTGQVAFYAANGTTVSGTSTLILSGGSVGIGTSPAHKLHVSSSATAVWLSRFINGTAEVYLAHGSGYGAYIDPGSNASASTYALNVIRGATSYFYVQGDGKVGIGSTTPAQKLTVVDTNPVVASFQNTTAGSYTNLRLNSDTTSVYFQFNTNSGSRAGTYGGVTLASTTFLETGGGAQLFYTASNNQPFIFMQTASNNPIERMRLSSTGNLGIGTTTPGEALVVNGNAQFTGVTSGSYGMDLNLTSTGVLTTSASDRRLKENLEPLSSSTLSTLMSLKTYTFNWIDDPSHKTDYGMVAQEVYEIMPGITFTNPKDGYMGINYSRLIPMIIKGMQVQQVQIDELYKYATIIKVKEVHAEKICIGEESDEVCITKDQLRDIMLNNGQTPISSGVSTQTNSTADEGEGASGTTSENDVITPDESGDQNSDSVETNSVPSSEQGDISGGSDSGSESASADVTNDTSVSGGEASASINADGEANI